jgi:hypothetical protein
MAGIPYYSIVPCCPSSGTEISFFNFPIVGGAPDDGVYSYIGDEITINGITFTPAYCYTITQEGSVFTTYPEAPSLDDFSPVIDGCEDLKCECEVVLSYYTLNDCCTNEPYTVDGDILYIEYENFCSPDLCPIDLENVIITSISNEGAGGIFLEGCFNLTSVPDPGPANVIYTWGAFIQEVTTVPVCADCQDCFQCYTLYACDGSTFNTTTDLSANVGTYIRIEDDTKTWYVIEDPTKTICDNAIDVVLDTVSVKTPCVLTCYQVTGTPATVTYMNADYDIITVIGATRVCSFITPIVTGAGSGFVVELGLCVDGECPEICFEFTNCQTGEVLVVSNSPTVIPYYAQEQVVTLQGYDGCWSIDITEVCECPVSVTILTAYASCPACLPIVNYKFTNCNNQSIIRYSIDDYSVYVGKTVELECGECWFVSEIDYIPPSTQSIVILYTFDNCTACNRNYYKLTDCLDPNNVTYTYTDLSALFVSTVQQDCTECINVTFKCNNVDYSFDLPVVEIFDGKRRFRITNISICNYSNADIDILWVQSPNPAPRWSFSVLGTEISSISNDTECPFGNYPNSSAIEVPFTNIVVAPCSVPPVIKIKGCDNCFTVEETREPINAGIVTVTDSYIDCPECLETFPCECTQVTNTTLVEQTYCYLDCDFNEQSIVLLPGESSEKICVINWVACSIDTCACINITLDFGQVGIFDILEPTGNIINNKPEYISNTVEGAFIATAAPSTNCWILVDDNDIVIATLCDSLNINCPIGTWTSDSDIITGVFTSYCTEGTTTIGTTSLPEYIQNFGNCTNGVCPVEVLPKRKVKPGYSTPSCDIEKYEKITCRSSEILYKQVIRLRYGISNCCPEDDEKWLIKKELIDLDALRDPDYICKPTTSCCNQPITSCGCDCNSTLKTCNS